MLFVVSGMRFAGKVEKEAEWPTLVFFMMPFVAAAGGERTGLIETVADWVHEAAQSLPVPVGVNAVRVSAILSAVVDKTPFTATMLSAVAILPTSIRGIDGKVLSCALLLGACLGGDGSIIGASANGATVGLAGKPG